MKKVIMGIVAVIGIISASMIIVSASAVNGRNFTDADGNGICDYKHAACICEDIHKNCQRESSRNDSCLHGGTGARHGYGNRQGR